MIGILNLVVLIDIVRIFLGLRRGELDEAELEARLQDRGFMNRFFIGGLARQITASWQMFPLGVLFGLGFDTASEVGLLAIAAGVATHHVPFLAVISLPLLFAAGMSLMDTADGAFMTHAYGWAFSNPVRKVFYNITVTSLSVTVALVIGTVELLQVLSVSSWIDNLDFGTLGYGVVGLFVLTWAGSFAFWKLRRIEERWAAPAPAPARSGRDERDPGERQADPDPLGARHALAQDDRGERDRHDRVERREHRGQADEPVARRGREEQVAERVADADRDDDRELPAAERAPAGGGRRPRRATSSVAVARKTSEPTTGRPRRRRASAGSRSRTRARRAARARRRPRRAARRPPGAPARRARRRRSRVAIPASCAGEGRSPVAIPKTTGTIADAPAIGATTLIVPVTIPR